MRERQDRGTVTDRNTRQDRGAVTDRNTEGQKQDIVIGKEKKETDRKRRQSRETQTGSHRGTNRHRNACAHTYTH